MTVLSVKFWKLGLALYLSELAREAQRFPPLLRPREAVDLNRPELH